MIGTTLALAAGGGIAALGAGTAGGYWFAKREAEGSVVEELEGLEHGSGFRMNRSKLQTGGSLSRFAKAYGAEKEEEKALSKGQIRWHLVGAGFSEPMYVKPEREAGGTVPELEYEGERYVFPPEASVPSQEEGVPVVIHREGEAEPINLADSWEEAIDAGSLEQYLTTRVTSTAPEESGGLLGAGLADLDPMQILQYGILGLVAVFVALEVLG